MRKSELSFNVVVISVLLSYTMFFHCHFKDAKTYTQVFIIPNARSIFSSKCRFFFVIRVLLFFGQKQNTRNPSKCMYTFKNTCELCQCVPTHNSYTADFDIFVLFVVLYCFRIFLWCFLNLAIQIGTLIVSYSHNCVVICRFGD